MECIFCQIVNKVAAANIIYEDDQVIAFDDLYPKAPHHKLIIPRQHIATLNDVSKDDSKLVGHIMYVAQTLAKKLNFAADGYRVIMNCNQDGGQLVYHLHLHLMGGHPLQWPPG